MTVTLYSNVLIYLWKNHSVRKTNCGQLMIKKKRSGNVLRSPSMLKNKYGGGSRF